MIGIVESRADEASEHVCEHLRRLGDFEEWIDDDLPDADGGGTVLRSDAFELRSFDALHLELVDVADAFDDPDLVVFASRHSGDTGPLLSAHPTGNFGDAEYGGEARSLAIAPPNALSTVLHALADHAPEGYDVGLECTHHGPTEVGAPSTFVELGSGPEEWADPDGAEAVARAILDLADGSRDGPEAGATAGGAVAAERVDGRRRRHLVGFGGGHYAPRFTRIARETDWAVGHVAADWSLEELGDPDANRDVVEQVFERSSAELAVVDGDRPALESVIEDLGYRVVGETWVRETHGVPLGLVETAERRLCSVADGLRFGSLARERERPDADDVERPDATDLECPGASDLERPDADDRERPDVDDDLGVVDLPTELLDAAAGVDREATMAALRASTVAFETVESGTRPGARALVAGDGLPDLLVDRLAAVLRERFDAVATETDRIVAEESAFDPELARAAGVPEGPAFGRLSAGEAVQVDGATVEPADVHERRRIAFDLAGAGADSPD